MVDNFEQILDECIDRINKGESIEACLADNPQYAQRLKLHLKTVLQMQSSLAFTPSEEAERNSKQRFYNALDKKRQGYLWERLFTRKLALVAVIGVFVLIVGGFFGLKMIGFQAQPPVIMVSAPSLDGNFIFLVSDEVNAIFEFSSLNVSVSKVDMLQDNSTQHVQFSPETRQFDLTLLPGDLTQQLWRGNIPEGKYSEVVIHVSNVSGTLKSSGDTIDIKLPSDKLHMTRSFEVGPDSITSFIYDLTVIKAGNAQNGCKYLLKPQINESGATHTDKSNPGKTKDSPKK
jgi:hypothetical protein